MLAVELDGIIARNAELPGLPLYTDWLPALVNKRCRRDRLLSHSINLLSHFRPSS